jgi:membrane protease YdiL (CAAX protease family)
MLGLAGLANVLIHLLSDGGESSLLGLPPGFIESTILSSIPFGVAWLYTVRKYGRPLHDLGVVKPAKPQAYLIAVGAWVLAYLAVGIWSQLVSGIDALTPPDNTTTSIELAGGSVVLAILLVGMWGPVMEEIFFRGFLQGSLRDRIGPWPAVLLSSAIFALFHISPGLFVPTFLLGVAFGWVYLRTRSVWPSVLVHALHNTLAVIVVWQGLG